jgi:glycosyltransferase involved in cell wall biosynthesis
VFGVPEMIGDGQEGLLVEPNDPVALAAAIAELRGEPGAAFGRRAYARARRCYDARTMLERQLALLREASLL